MEFLGVGPLELIFILIIALIVLGPKDLEKTGRTVGQWLNRIVQSDAWKALKTTSQELRRLPTQLMKEDNLRNYPLPSDLEREAKQKQEALRAQPTHPPAPPRADFWPGAASPNSIAPPAAARAASKSAPVKEAAAGAAKSPPKKPVSKKKAPAVKPSPAPRKKKNA